MALGVRRGKIAPHAEPLTTVYFLLSLALLIQGQVCETLQVYVGP